jgi:DNA helicase HerA-like ATPase
MAERRAASTTGGRRRHAAAERDHATTQSSGVVRLADDLTLPLDVVTEAIGILARRRAGKSYLARKLVEQLLQADLPVVIVDPKGDHWGLRSSADGTRPGFPS